MPSSKHVIPVNAKILIPVIAVLAVSAGAFALTQAFNDGSSDASLSTWQTTTVPRTTS